MNGNMFESASLWGAAAFAFIGGLWYGWLNWY